MRRPTPVLIALLLLASTAGLSRAATPWVALVAGGSGYAMDDVNRDIDAINASLTSGEPLKPLKDVNRGMLFGGGGGFDFANRMSVGLGVERLMARSRVSSQFGSLTLDLPGDLVRLFAEYRSADAGRSGLVVGASAGWIWQNGTFAVGALGSDGEVRLESDGFAGEVYAGGRLRASGWLALLGTLGYRVANSGNYTVNRQEYTNPDRSEYTVDFSGVFLRIGARISVIE